MKKTNSRFIELDVLRGVSIIGVILIHILGGSFHFWPQGSTVWTAFIAIDQFFRFSVPLFVFISGYSLYSKYKDNFKLLGFYIKRAQKVLPWYVVWCLINYAYIHLTVKPGFVDYPTWKLIFLGKVDYHFYFVSMILQLYLLFPIFLYLYKKFKLNFAAAIFILEAILYFVFTLDGSKIIQLPWRFYEQQQYLFFGTWLFYFVWGFTLSEKLSPSAKLKLKKYQFLFPILTLAILTYSITNSLHLIAQTSDTNVATRSTRIPVLLYATGFATTSLIYSAIFLKMKKCILNALLYFARVSYLVYLTHVLIIRVLGNFILPNTIFHLVIFTILVFAGSIFLAQVSLFISDVIPFNKLIIAGFDPKQTVS